MLINLNIVIQHRISVIDRFWKGGALDLEDDYASSGGKSAKEYRIPLQTIPRIINTQHHTLAQSSSCVDITS
jgi:hypothetical protein